MALALITGFPVSADDFGPTAAVDATGADLIVCYCQGPATTNPSANVSMADSEANTYTKVEPLGSDDFGCWFWCVPASVSATMTFTISSVGHSNGMVVYAFSGANATPFDDATGFSDVFLESIQPGSITPAVADSVFVAGLTLTQVRTPTINGSFTGLVTGTGSTDGGTFAAAYLLASGTGAQNPTWDWTGQGHGGTCSAFLIAFKPAAGGGGGGILRQMMQHHHYRKPRRDRPWRRHDSGLYLRAA